MNNRERTMALILIVVMFVFGGGFVVYQFIFEPWKKAKNDVARITGELSDLDMKLDMIRKQEADFQNVTKKRSLPLDETLAQREYEQLLDRMLRKAGFTTPNITPRPANSQNVPTIGNKKPLYKKLAFDVKVKGDLETVVDFLFSFYSQPVLHQIRTINLVKPIQPRFQNPMAMRGNYDLDVSLTIEALVIDQAENRPTLFPSSPSVIMAASGLGSAGFSSRLVEKGDANIYSLTDSLAHKEGSSNSKPSLKEYRRLARKDIFFGIAPTSQGAAEVKQAADLSPFLRLVAVTHSNGRNSATIWDRFNNEDYEIEEDTHGKIKVAKYHYKRRPDANGLVTIVRQKYTDEGDDADYNPNYLTFGKESTGNERSFVVRRVVENGIIIQEYDENRVKMLKRTAPLAFGGAAKLVTPGKCLLWEAGQFLKSSEAGKSVVPVANPQAELIRPLLLINEKTEDDKPEKAEKDRKRPGRNR